jgi:hypothetical protein
MILPLPRALLLSALVLPALSAAPAVQEPGPDETQQPAFRGFELPSSPSAMVLAWKEDPVRPVVHVLATGEIVAGGHTSAAGKPVDELGELQLWLMDQSRVMQRTRDPANPSGWTVRSPLLIRADARAPFERVMALMWLCGTRDVRIADLRLAVRRADGGDGMLSVALPTHEALAQETSVPLRLAALPGGALECRHGSASTRERASLGSWLTERIGEPGRIVSVEVGPTVTCADVVAFLDACAVARVAAVRYSSAER